MNSTATTVTDNGSTATANSITPAANIITTTVVPIMTNHGCFLVKKDLPLLRWGEVVAMVMALGSSGPAPLR